MIGSYSVSPASICDRADANLPANIKSWDANYAIGGPIVRDRLWFFSNVRTFGNYTERAGLGWNANAGNPAVWDYKSDLTKSVRDANSKKTGAIRLTGQLTPRNKLGMYFDYQKQCTGSSYSADGEQCRGPGPCVTHREELVEHAHHRRRRTDRVPGDERVAAEVGVGQEGLPVAGEEEALVVTKREVGEGVPAVGMHEAGGVLPIRACVRPAGHPRCGTFSGA